MSNGLIADRLAKQVELVDAGKKPTENLMNILNDAAKDFPNIDDFETCVGEDDAHTVDWGDYENALKTWKEKWLPKKRL